MELFNAPESTKCWEYDDIFIRFQIMYQLWFGGLGEIKYSKTTFATCSMVAHSQTLPGAPLRQKFQAHLSDIGPRGPSLNRVCRSSNLTQLKQSKSMPIKTLSTLFNHPLTHPCAISVTVIRAQKPQYYNLYESQRMPDWKTREKIPNLRGTLLFKESQRKR